MKPLSLPFLQSLSSQDKINFARHLSMVIKAGLPVYEGLRIINTQTVSKTLKRIIDHVMVDINNGRSLADALGVYERLFGSFFINIIRVGEASGTLSANLLYLAEELRKAKELNSKVRSAMVYPLIILIATIAVTIFLTFFVFPKLLPVLQGLNVQLPLTTRALIGAIEFLRQYGLFVLLGAIVLGVALRFVIKRVRPVRMLAHRSLLIIPAVSPLLVSVNMVNLTRVLALLLKSGVKIIDALHITSGTFENLVYKEALLGAQEEIRKGGQLGAYFSRHKRLFPPLVSGMVEIGENTGNLEENLAYLAEYYEDEVGNKLQQLTSLLEPIMLLFMGLMVGFVAISIITPIYSISQGVR